MWENNKKDNNISLIENYKNEIEKLKKEDG